MWTRMYERLLPGRPLENFSYLEIVSASTILEEDIAHATARSTSSGVSPSKAGETPMLPRCHYLELTCIIAASHPSGDR